MLSNIFRTFHQYFHTIRFLKPQQIYGRIWILIKYTLLKPIIVWRVNKATIQSINHKLNLVPKPFNGALLKCEPKNQRFFFLNRERTFNDTIDWNDQGMEKLWLYNLHYFEYLLALIKDYSKQNFIIGKSIITKWIENNPIGYGNGWESYPLSLRIVNWLFFFDRYYSFFKNDQDFRILFLTSLYRQITYLKFFLEIHLQANHLFENIKSLLFAAVFFQDRKIFVKVWKLLQNEIHEQILDDGGHYERSPMYHSIILTDFLDILNILRQSENSGIHSFVKTEIKDKTTSDKSWLYGIAVKMLRWLEHMVHPDSEIALFGDSAFGIAPSLTQLKDYFTEIQQIETESYSSVSFNSLENSGYFIFKNNMHYLVLDGGELGVRYQPGHVHCDLFSYEYSFESIRFFVDAGVGSYQKTDLRNKARSVYSHNTVVVNGKEQAELWKIHRVGRWVKLLSAKKEKNKSGISFVGQYENSIYPNEVYQHLRRVIFVNNRFFSIEDQIRGKSIYSIESLIHFHPQCKFEQDANIIQLNIMDKSVCILWDDKKMFSEIKEWFYIPEFGKLVKSNRLVLKPGVDNNGKLCYVITPLGYINEAREYLLNALL